MAVTPPDAQYGRPDKIGRFESHLDAIGEHPGRIEIEMFPRYDRPSIFVLWLLKTVHDMTHISQCQCDTG